jgi:3-oxoacyl-[acyl-carrier protein] reductase
MHEELRDKTALITGASIGIGAAAAVALARLGVNILIHYNSHLSDAEAVLREVEGAGVRGQLFQADLGTRDGVHHLIGAIRDLRIDMLINNAGSLVERRPNLEMTEELWDRVLMLNLTSAYFVTQAVLPQMVERKSGVVVNVSSVAARHGGGKGATAYSTAKGGLSVMTKGLAKEFAAHGIRINAVSPGTIDTNFHRTFSNEQMLDGVRAATPMGRLGTSEETADVIVFLCTDQARFIQGQVIEVNGGFLMV